MSKYNADTVSYVIVVSGMPEGAHALFSERFPKHLGGVNPRIRETYHSVECDIADVRGNIEWVVNTLSGQYTSLRLGINIYTPLNWANYEMPAEIICAVQEHAVSLKVMFSSPVKS
ncbi:hypothetical protein [Sphaerotilus sp.]|uniref:hypothetical protein n=1 Tax=Sphaerotilus sp. TaxID=2093942 RepID=UPI0025D73F88|nr:hypothetical protein [Sphaerotilus sp.]